MREPMTEMWSEPQDIDGLSAAFPTDVRHLMPAYEDIPGDFKGFTGKGEAKKWVEFQGTWFYSGLDGATLYVRDGIDRAKAIRHLATIQGSWEPKHEHKAAGVAYLASLWFTDWKPGGKKKR